MSAPPSNGGETDWSSAFGHRSVLLAETLEALAVKPDGFYVDATLGGGGHSRAILNSLAPAGRLLALDVDPEPLLWAEKWSQDDPRLSLKRLNFKHLAAFLAESGLGPADGLVADLGVSSRQLIDGRRGFSFAAAGPLDMRLDPDGELKAVDIVNNWSEQELKDTFWRLGEEKSAGRLAKAIVNKRQQQPFIDTASLSELAKLILWRPGPPPRIHPATRMFMALRLAVNQELESLTEFLTQARCCLKTGGRLVVISFHSLEDRLVKQTLRGILPEAAPNGRRASRLVQLEELNGATPVSSEWKLWRKKAVKPSEEELLTNPRARSARLRYAEAI
ncbi:MAG: 16S rRNA (cytosine(1402)-N(4))-methyltransferase RsmH [Deltaproteobacteria bacterium]|nr:16S rRNA (cytosine(1402)-N(4))-methyltransferase RsmH [Deltaproteobacteria bacterium]